MRHRKQKLIALSLILLCGLLTAGCVGLNNAVSVPHERRATVHLAGLHRETQPIRIALLSDIHVGNLAMTPDRLSDIVRRVNQAEPDIVVLAGDFIIGESKEGAAERALDLAPLAALRASGGVFAVLGNHDHWTDPDSIRQNLAKAGVQVLENTAVRRGPIAIVGIGDRFSGHDNIAGSAAQAAAVGGVPVAFTHSPDIFPELPQQFSLLLAGHTHCGQMVVPLFGPIVRYSQWRPLYNQKYRCGQIEEGDRSIFVTAGVGPGAVPLRFNAMPDWWLIELNPRSPASDNVKS
jgi:predicted MPP superfamily phosphohydrolase